MTDQPQHPFGSNLVNLADARLGAEAIFATDDFFAPKERLLNPEPAVFIPGKYDDHGKWMDGWESRRKRTEGEDRQPQDLPVVRRAPQRSGQRHAWIVWRRSIATRYVRT